MELYVWVPSLIWGASFAGGGDRYSAVLLGLSFDCRGIGVSYPEGD